MTWKNCAILIVVPSTLQNKTYISSWIYMFKRIISIWVLLAYFHPRVYPCFVSFAVIVFSDLHGSTSTSVSPRPSNDVSFVRPEVGVRTVARDFVSGSVSDHWVGEVRFRSSFPTSTSSSSREWSGLTVHQSASGIALLYDIARWDWSATFGWRKWSCDHLPQQGSLGRWTWSGVSSLEENL